jgi:predicted GTPase
VCRVVCVVCRVMQWEKYVQETLKFMKYVPIMFCSAKTGSHTHDTRHTTRHTPPMCWLTNSL